MVNNKGSYEIRKHFQLISFNLSKPTLFFIWKMQLPVAKILHYTSNQKKQDFQSLILANGVIQNKK